MNLFNAHKPLSGLVKNLLIFIFVFIVVGFVYFIKFDNSSADLDASMYDEGGVIPLRVATPYPLLGNMINSVSDGKVEVVYVNCEGQGDDCIDSFAKMAESEKIKLFFSLGLGFDGWTNKITDVKVIDLSQDMMPIHTSYQNIFDIDNNDVKDEYLPRYYWLSIHNAQKMVNQIARALGQFDIINREIFISLAYDYNLRLQEVYKEFDDALKPVRKNKIVLFRDQWGDMINDFSLPVGGVFDLYKDENRNDFFGALKKYLQKNRKNYVLADALFPTQDFLDYVKDQKIKIASIDPFGDLFKTDYIDIMRYNVFQIIKASP